MQKQSTRQKRTKWKISKPQWGTETTNKSSKQQRHPEQPERQWGSSLPSAVPVWNLGPVSQIECYQILSRLAGGLSSPSFKPVRTNSLIAHSPKFIWELMSPKGIGAEMQALHAAWSILRAKGSKNTLIRRRQKSALIFSANEPEGTLLTAFAGGLNAVWQRRSLLNLTFTIPGRLRWWLPYTVK